MKGKIVITTFLLFLISSLKPPFSQAQNNREWYPFVLPTQMDQNTPVNSGKAVLDAPAGKHGFVKVKKGHFYYEDGTRAKFWGINLGFNANFPTHKQAEIMADRIAFFGFNAVRFILMDFSFEPRGIWEDQAPAYNNPQMKRTGHLSPRQLDRLDYLIFQLKKRGIYADISLLVSRHFTKADGVADADQLDMAAKPASNFDPRLIELQKQYAHDLLTHINRYTCLHYSDEPAIALIEITNENSIIGAWRYNQIVNLPKYYLHELDVLWNTWLAKNLPPDKKQFYISLEHRYLDDMKNYLKSICAIKVPITGIGGYFAEDSFTSQADMDYIDRHAYWDHPFFPHKPWDTNDFIIQDRSLIQDENLGFISDLLKTAEQTKKFNKPFTVSEWNHCYPNRYAYETPVLLAAEAHKNDWDGLFEFSLSRGWQVSPEFDNIEYYFDIIANPQKLILNSIASRLFLGNSDSDFNIADGIFFLKSPQIIGAAGRLKGRSLDLGVLNVTVITDGAVFLYSSNGKPIAQSSQLVLLTLGDVANTNSGWRNNTFDWGEGPTRLENIDIKISLAGRKKWKIYHLTQRGQRGKEILLKSKDNGLTSGTEVMNAPWVELISF